MPIDDQAKDAWALPEALDGELRMSIQMRRKDIDSLDHLTHSEYHNYFAEARIELLRSLLDASSQFVLVRVEVDYLREVRFTSAGVTVLAWINAISRRSITIEHRLLSGPVTSARCRAVLAAWDGAHRRSREVTDGERDALAKVAGGATAGREAREAAQAAR